MGGLQRIPSHPLDRPHSEWCAFGVNRRIRVELRPGQYEAFDARLSVVGSMELPENATEASQTLYLPQDRQYGELDVRVFEAGELLEELSQNIAILRGSPDQMWIASAPTVLLIDEQYRQPTRPQGLVSESDGPPVPAMAALMNVFRLGGYDQNGQSVPLSKEKTAKAKDLTDAFRNVDAVHPDLVPSAPAGLSGIDLVLATSEQLARFKQLNPTGWRTFRAWLLTGGVLITTDAADAASRSDLESLLQLPPLPFTRRPVTAGRMAMPREPFLAWRMPSLREFGAVPEIFQNNANIDRSYAMDPDDEPVRASAPAAPSTAARFVVRPAQMGTVVAFLENDFPDDETAWDWLFHAVPSQCWLWSQRHGLTLQDENTTFWDHLIPGVGLPPVNTFRVVITVLVLLLGPINYYLLKRYGRLSWLLATIPLGALVAIVGLLGFGLLTEGFSVRARNRSLTHLDQRIGSAATWSRQTYYGGLVPTDGMVYPLDVVVLPLEYHPVANQNPLSAPFRYLSWGDRQSFRRGYFRPRTTTQVMVIRARRSSASVEFRPAARDNERESRPTVVNRLGCAIRLLFIRDDAGTDYLATDLADGQTATLQPIESDQVRSRLNDVFAGVALRPPVDFDAQSMRDLSFLDRRYHGIYANSIPETVASTSVLEQRLAEVEQLGLDALGANSFVAIVDRDPEVPLGVSDPILSQSLFVVTGNW